MSTLKEKCQVVILPTELESNLSLMNNELYYSEIGFKNYKGFKKTFTQHLYILSNDEIKELPK